MDKTTIFSENQITLSEIALLKCVRSKDYENWLNCYGGESNNPFVYIAKEKYDDCYFEEHQSLSGLRKYMQKFPNGKNLTKAQLMIYDIESQKKTRSQRADNILENVGVTIILCIFLGLLIIPMVAKGWAISETFSLAISFAPLYWLVYVLTKRKD